MTDNPYQSPNSESSSVQLKCVACDKMLHVSASFCPGCGASQRKRTYKNKNIAAVFAFFFGAFGVHRFYLGQWWGIIYLVTCWTLVPGFIAFIEMIVFLMANQVKWDDKHNEGRPAGAGDSSKTGIIVGVMAGMFFLVMLIGVIAAISIPAYHDYSRRAKVGLALSDVVFLKGEVAQFIDENNAFPEGLSGLGLEDPYYSSSGDRFEVIDKGKIRITFHSDPSLEAKTMILTPSFDDSSFSWSCQGGDLQARHRPASCR